MGTIPFDIAVTEKVRVFVTDLPFVGAHIPFMAEGLGVAALLGAIIFIFSHVHRSRGMAHVLAVLGAGLGAYGLSAALKAFIERARPEVALEHVDAVIAYTGAYDSFPSGHATFFAAVATALFLYHRGLGSFFFVIALVIGVGRVAAGVHWVSDIVAGIGIGILGAVLVYKGIHFVIRRLKR